MPGMAYFGSIYFGQEPYASTGGFIPVPPVPPVLPPAPAVGGLGPRTFYGVDPDEELVLVGAAQLLFR